MAPKIMLKFGKIPSKVPNQPEIDTFGD